MIKSVYLAIASSKACFRFGSDGAIAEALAGKPEEEQRQALAKIYAESGPFAAKSAVNALKDIRRDAARQITPEDEAIRSIGNAKDKAEFDAFMAARRDRPQGSGAEGAE